MSANRALAITVKTVFLYRSVIVILPLPGLLPSHRNPAIDYRQQALIFLSVRAVRL
jgi:hypothetical protein